MPPIDKLDGPKKQTPVEERPTIGMVYTPVGGLDRYPWGVHGMRMILSSAVALIPEPPAFGVSDRAMDTVDKATEASERSSRLAIAAVAVAGSYPVRRAFCSTKGYG
ncbi:hypothetical protein CS387_00020 [Porphyromonas gingivalis]|nr:hypothetical protein CS387_00020 [Porphyromonas gingivalis]